MFDPDKKRDIGGIQLPERLSKKDARKRVIERARMEIDMLRKKHQVNTLTPYQYRISEVLDIFVTNKKYHDIRNNRRGTYRDLSQFVEEFFRLNPLRDDMRRPSVSPKLKRI
jgi:CRISPR/Cas system-associated endonuclease Cas3-HD